MKNTKMKSELALLVMIMIRESLQHGYMIDPPSRSSLWRVNPKGVKNYDDNRLYCGGRSTIQKLGGLCGPCGDPYDGKRENEAGGKYAKGIISKQLPDGATILESKVVITAFHKGYFEFRICANNDVTKPVTQECLNENLMTVVEGDSQYPTRFYPPGRGEHHVHLHLPEGIKCSQCVVQWRYRTGNSWGRDLDGTSCIGCGVQEEFRNCADISIGSGSVTMKTGDVDKARRPIHRVNNRRLETGELVDPLVTERNKPPKIKTIETESKSNREMTFTQTDNKFVQKNNLKPTNTLIPRPNTVPVKQVKLPEFRPIIRQNNQFRQNTIAPPRIRTVKPTKSTFRENENSRFINSQSKTQLRLPNRLIPPRRTQKIEKPRPRISFRRENTTPYPRRFQQPRQSGFWDKERERQLTILAKQMKKIMRALHHLPIFQNLDLGDIDEKVLGQKSAPWNNLAASATKRQSNTRKAFPWKAGVSFGARKDVTQSNVRRQKASPRKHIYVIPPNPRDTRPFRRFLNPPRMRAPNLMPNPLLTGQFRKEKTREIQLSSPVEVQGAFRKQKTRVVNLNSENKIDNSAKPTDAPVDKPDKIGDMPLYSNEYNVISPESLEGGSRIKDWYKKILQLMVDRKYPVEKVNKMIQKLKLIKEPNKTEDAASMLERLSAHKDNSVSNSFVNRQTTQSVQLTNPIPTVSSFYLPTTPFATPIARPTVHTFHNGRFVSHRQSVPLNQHRQRMRDINAIPRNENTLRRPISRNQNTWRRQTTRNQNTLKRPLVKPTKLSRLETTYLDNNYVAPPQPRPLSTKVKNFLNAFPHIKLPFGAVFR